MRKPSNLKYGILGILFWCIAIYAFSIIAPWTTAISIDELDPKYSNQIREPYAAAFIIEHGNVKPWRKGTIAQNYIEFSVWIVLMLTSASITVFLAIRHFKQKQKGSDARYTNCEKWGQTNYGDEKNGDRQVNNLR